MITLIGNKGNMGSRYSAILRYLGNKFDGYDRDAVKDEVEASLSQSTKIIVATPTATHVSVLIGIAAMRAGKALPVADVLCEKPITTKLEEFQVLRDAQTQGRMKIYCVNQYAHHPQAGLYLTSLGSYGRTHYNYFKHGTDGLAWDCFPLFVLARGGITINNQSPIWTCRINGTRLQFSGMDQAYVSMVEDFLGPKNNMWGLDIVERGTKKVLKWIADEAADISESQSPA